ncbi:MAG: hypothetical protein WC499_00725 [Patescibacteria group bacterium]
MLFFGFYNFSFAQINQPKNSEISQATNALDAKYINILEKVNQQLSFRWNPYNIILSILTFLVMIFTIIFAVITWMQGREFKIRLEKNKREFKTRIDDFFGEQNKITQKWLMEQEEKYTKLITEYNLKLEELKKNPQDKEEIKRIKETIEELKKEKVTLSSQIGPITVTPEIEDYFPASGISLFGKTVHQCSYCGYRFKIKKDPFIATASVINHETVACPKCGNQDSI